MKFCLLNSTRWQFLFCLASIIFALWLRWNGYALTNFPSIDLFLGLLWWPGTRQIHCKWLIFVHFQSAYCNSQRFLDVSPRDPCVSTFSWRVWWPLAIKWWIKLKNAFPSIKHHLILRIGDISNSQMTLIDLFILLIKWAITTDYLNPLKNRCRI